MVSHGMLGFLEHRFGVLREGLNRKAKV